jgi:hypothetical protein
VKVVLNNIASVIHKCVDDDDDDDDDDADNNND